MSCPLCDEQFDNHIIERRAYVVCANDDCGYTMCGTCISGWMQARARITCPNCRGPCRPTPVFTRIHTVEADQVAALDPMDVAEVAPASVSQEVVLLIDVSGSMQQQSGEKDGAPTRLELAVHMAKVMLAFCRKLGLKCSLYTFSERLTKVPVDEKTPPEQSNRALHAVKIEGMTYLHLALNGLRRNHSDDCFFFVFTDGEPTENCDAAIRAYANAQLHVFAFGSAVSTDLLAKVAENPTHTISYIEDVRSISGYMVPVFIWAVTHMKTVTLSESDEQCRKKFVELLGPQVRGKSFPYKMQDLVEMLGRFHSRYAEDLKTDTVDQEHGHGRIAYSFDQENWKSFGQFYLLCILHCHRYLIPGNAFDPSLRHYRTPEYTEVFEKIADVPTSVDFVAFAADASTRAQASAAASAVMAQSFGYMDSYTASSNDSDGCIGPDEKIEVFRGARLEPVIVSMKDLRPGDRLANGRVKWIIRITNLNGDKPVSLYNGLTRCHPVRDDDGIWRAAAAYQGGAVKITQTTGVVYDVILDDPTIGTMKVNGMDAAVVGFRVPGMPHPYWGSQKVVADVRARYPNGGFVDVDAKEFQFADGLVSSLFGK